MNNEKYNQIIDEAYENYKKHIETQRDIQKEEVERLRSQGKRVKVGRINLLSREEFINKCKTDSEFSEKWGLKIEERELSGDERFRIAYKNLELRKKLELESMNLHYPNGHNKVMDDANVPTKLITVTYKNETIEVYELTSI